MRSILWTGSLVLACALISPQASARAVPPNKLRIKVNALESSGITKEEFDSLLETAIAPWVSIAKAKGATLTIEKDWKSDWVYAAADRKENSWTIDFKGGMARHPLMTRDGLTLLVCHELGHHFGGFPFAHYWVWFANEGQADYFAAHVCARQVWSKEDNSKFREIINVYAKSLCEKAWEKTEEQNLCYRTAQAGQDLGRFFSELSRTSTPEFSTPDPTVVNETTYEYPSPQGRMDTYFQGALCTAPFDLNFIPGADTPNGKMSPEAELESVPYSCTRTGGYSLGLRPASWFKTNY